MTIAPSGFLRQARDIAYRMHSGVAKRHSQRALHNEGAAYRRRLADETENRIKTRHKRSRVGRSER